MPGEHHTAVAFVIVAADGVEWTVTSGGQDWTVAWYPPPDPATRYPARLGRRLALAFLAVSAVAICMLARTPP